MPPLQSYVLTFNCGREPINPSYLAPHLFAALPSPSAPEILVFSLQEVAPIAYSFLGGSYLSSYLAPFHHAVSLASASLNSKPDYVHVITRNVGMTVIMVFALRTHKDRISDITTAGVGVGMHEMGNKGAVAVRLHYATTDDSTTDTPLELTAIAAHLAPMEDRLERRNEDWANIVRGLVFTPSSAKPPPQNPTTSSASSETDPLLPPPSAETPEAKQQNGIYTPTTHLLLAGDLNYRTSPSGPLTEEYRSFPQPASSPTAPEHYTHLLKSDQLTTELCEGRTCHGMSEGAIAFPPTYKYSDRARRDAEGEGATEGMDEEGRRWGWARHRWPSWCDRVLFLGMPSWATTTATKGQKGEGQKGEGEEEEEEVLVRGYTALPLLPSSDHRPVACCVEIPSRAIPAPEAEGVSDGRKEDGVRLHPPFELDPGWAERRAWARRREVVVGLGAWLGLTWEGRGVLCAVLAGGVGGWVVVAGLVG